MWLITTFEPVSLVSLKIATATSTGGKSLLLPTPFAFKMALLDVIIRHAGLEQGKSLWSAVRDGEIAINGPDQIAVNNTFTKILRPMKGQPTLDPDTRLVRTMVKTIGFREYVQWHGHFQIAFRPSDPTTVNWSHWLSMIGYFGKRGGFVQVIKVTEGHLELEPSFVQMRQSSEAFSLNGTLQVVEDCSPNLTFEHVDVYSDKNMRLGTDRILHHVIIPYRVVQSSRGYTLYQRL